MDEFAVGDLVWCAYYGLGVVTDKEYYPDGDFKGHLCEFASGQTELGCDLTEYKSSDFINLLKLETDETITSAVNAFDCYNLPIRRRFDGDTIAFDRFMKFAGGGDSLASKLIVSTAILREGIRRGLKIDFKN